MQVHGPPRFLPSDLEGLFASGETKHVPALRTLAGEKVAFSDVGRDVIILEGRTEPVISRLALCQTLCGQVKGPALWNGTAIFCTVCTLTYFHVCDCRGWWENQVTGM